MSVWVEKNTRLRKRPFSFKGYEFQRQIVDDMHPNMAVIKPSQVGLTEVQVRKYLGWLARNNGVTGIFSLPTDEMYKRVSQTRVGPMIQSEPVFNLGDGKPVRSMGLYQINQSFGYFTGAKESDATSISADILFNDEVDLTNQEMMALFSSRLQGSDYRIRQGFSTPTYQGFGIDAMFNVSDQLEYMVKCQSCRHFNIPEFNPDFIHIPGLSGDINDLTEIDTDMASKLDLAKANVCCEQCGNPLDLNDPELREWVPRYPGRRSRGYRVTPFATPKLGIEYIVDQLLTYKAKDAMRRFYNTVLGLSYNDSNARLSELEIKAVMQGAARIEVKAPIVIGIDMGLTCHMVIMHLDHERPVVFEWKQIPAEDLVEEVKRLQEEYLIIGGCIDRHPYTPMSNEIRDITDGKIIPVEYSGTANAAAVQLVKDELEQLSHIRANRTTMIDFVVQAIRKRAVDFIGYGQHEALIVQHLRDMVRIENEDQPAVWQKLTGNDHFFHALTYAFYATRVTDAINYRADVEAREMVTMDSSLIMTMKDGDALGLQSRRRTTMSLGTQS